MAGRGTGTSLAVDPVFEIVEDEDFELDESRFNPHHDKLGKFASKGASLDGWEYETYADRQARQLKKFEKVKGAPLTEAEKKDVLDGVGRSHQTLLSPNGEISIGDSSTKGIARSDAEQLAIHADHLHRNFPLSDEFGTGASVRVVKSSDIQPPRGVTLNEGEYIAADTIRGTGSIRLNEEVFSKTERQPKAESDTWAMPSASKVDRPTYVLYHEWGHASDKHSDEEVTQAFNELGNGLSMRGSADSREAYAEAFAEWTISGGTTQHKAARAYAERFGWKVME